MVQGTDKVAESVSIAVETAKEIPVRNEVTFSNGIILNCKSVPIMTLRYAHQNVSKPKPPIVRNKDKDRDEEWEGDPTYVHELEEWEEKVGDVGVNVMLMLGTSINLIPEGVDRPEDSGWIDKLTAAGISVKADSEPARYLSWLRLYAIATPQDLVDVSTLVAEKSGVLDKDVKASLDSFRSGETGGTDLETSPEERSGDGDSIPSANGRSHLRSGGEG